MSATKVAITMDEALLAKLDRLVDKNVFPNRSKAIQEAVQDKLARMHRGRLARECAKLDPRAEQTLAEEGIDAELNEWPEF
ncbi:MAG: ribbon-helix-helix domain-containing protein [Acidobacteriota bacterium]